MKKALVFAAFVLGGLGIGVGGPYAYENGNEWLKAPVIPVSEGGQVMINSLEKGVGWRLSRNSNSVVHEKAKIQVFLDHSPEYCLQQWKEHKEDSGDESQYIKQYPKTDHSHIQQAARGLKEKLLLCRFSENCVFTEVKGTK